jgi:hypothetical protein
MSGAKEDRISSSQIVRPISSLILIFWGSLLIREMGCDTSQSSFKWMISDFLKGTFSERLVLGNSILFNYFFEVENKKQNLKLQNN